MRAATDNKGGNSVTQLQNTENLQVNPMEVPEKEEGTGSGDITTKSFPRVATSRAENESQLSKYCSSLQFLET